MLFRCVTSTLSIVIFAWRWHEWVYVMKSLPVMKIDYVVSNLYLIILGTLGIACCISSIVSFKDSNLFGYGMVISSLLLAGRLSNLRHTAWQRLLDTLMCYDFLLGLVKIWNRAAISDWSLWSRNTFLCPLFFVTRYDNNLNSISRCLSVNFDHEIDQRTIAKTFNFRPCYGN